MVKKIFILFSFCITFSISFAASTLHHKISVTVDPAKHTLEAIDQITIPADQSKTTMFFLLNSNLNITSQSQDVTITLDKSGVKAEDLGMDREDFNHSSEITQNKYILTFKNEIKGDVTFSVTYSGTIHYPIKQLGEEYARGFSQTPGIIDEKGEPEGLRAPLKGRMRGIEYESAGFSKTHLPRLQGHQAQRRRARDL